ncbi:MAG: hypothetical protein ACO3X1_06780, partial [Burkholderiaceae bacterium]
PVTNGPAASSSSGLATRMTRATMASIAAQVKLSQRFSLHSLALRPQLGAVCALSSTQRL